GCAGAGAVRVAVAPGGGGAGGGDGACSWWVDRTLCVSGRNGAMRKLVEWLEQNRKLALVIGGAVALVLVVAVGWMTIVGQSEPPEVESPQPSESTTGTDAGSGGDPDDEESAEVGPSELPDSDVSEDVARWEVRELAPIEATTDPVEFAEKFSQVW